MSKSIRLKGIKYYESLRRRTGIEKEAIDGIMCSQVRTESETEKKHIWRETPDASGVRKLTQETVPQWDIRGECTYISTDILKPVQLHSGSFLSQ